MSRYTPVALALVLIGLTSSLQAQSLAEASEQAAAIKAAAAAEGRDWHPVQALPGDGATGPAVPVQDAAVRDLLGAIRQKCAADWPDDFKMRLYCETQQIEAGKTWATKRPLMNTSPATRQIAAKCFREWSTPVAPGAGSTSGRVDWKMVNFCEDQQVKALAQLAR